ncbi:MAG: hypothetical protein AB1609_23560, partial [Bacillota bacterium]
MSTIRRTTLGNLALLLFVAFLFQVVMATGALLGTARANASKTPLTTSGENVWKEDGWVHVRVTLSPITPLLDGWYLHLRFPGLPDLGVKVDMTLSGTVDDQVYTSVYTGVYDQVYATVYASTYQMLLALRYLPSPDVYVGPGYKVEFTQAEWDSVAQTVYLSGIFRPPPLPPPAVPVPTTVPTDTGVL